MKIVSINERPKMRQTVTFFYQNVSKMVQKWSKIVQNRTLERLGGHFGQKGAQGSKICSPRAIMLDKNDNKLSQNWVKRAPEINPNSSLIFEAILERFWLPEVTKRASFLAPKFHFLQKKSKFDEN